MLKNALIFLIEDWQAPALSSLEEALQSHSFVACGPSQAESVGWVAPRGQAHGALAESIGGQIILKLCTEKKGVPASVINEQVELQLDNIEAESGRRPKGKAVKELKEQIVHSLLPRAFPKRSSTPIWIDAKAGRVVVGASSMKRADAALSQLNELMGGTLKLQPLQTQLSPTTAMAGWLREQEGPAGFTLDRECELKQPDLDKPAVRYSRHALEIAEIAAHIEQGKLPTQLALSWQGRVSFVLHESGGLRKLKLLDVALEGQGAATDGKDDGFDADVALTTGELSQLIPDLIEALGGRQMPS